MDKKKPKFILLLIAAVVIGIFLFKNIYPTVRNRDNQSSQTNKKETTDLNRNIQKLFLTKHAICRMGCRDITEEEIKEILREGDINYAKSNLNDKRGATYALEGYSDDRQHLRIIFAPEKDRLVVVTCIDLNKEWQCDCN
jgi:Na+/melibiose symporter-like transporter